MEPVSPNRMSLLLLRDLLAATQKGLDLLKAKREALLREFFPLWDQAVTDRERLRNRVGEACAVLTASRGLTGREELKSASYGAAREIPIEISRKNLWGIRFPEIRYKTLSRAIDARGYAFPGVSAGVDLTAGAFERVLEEILHMATREVKLKKLGEELKRLSRRIRLLEDQTIPDLLAGIQKIRQTLDERAREELFRLKRLKRKDAGA